MGGLSEVGQSCKEATNTIINDIKQLVMTIGILINLHVQSVTYFDIQVIQQNGIIGQNDRSRLDLELFGIAIPWTTFYGCVFYVPDCDCLNSSIELYLCKLDIRLYGGKVVEQLSESVSHVLVCGSCDNRHLCSSNETKQKFVTKQWIEKCIENRVLLKNMYFDSL